jgi:hypothetical protein
MPGKRRNPVVYLATAPNEPIAYMWAGILADQGVHCLVKRGLLSSAPYVYSQNLPCEIHVLASKLRKASEVLEPFLKSAEPEAEKNPERNSTKEPHKTGYLLMWSWYMGIIPFIMVIVYTFIKAIKSWWEAN